MNDLFDVIYLVYEKRLKTQREFAEELFLSLGKVNALLKEAVELDYIIDGKDYELTDKGRELLETHKVDNAVIMAAGFGSRFVPMTYETPKGLLEVKGEVLIERQIKQLHEVGITDITIVVGYLKETFEYLTDKYNVKLIYNPDYGSKNNISSLYYAKKEFKNTYLLTSDIYMERNLYRPYEYYSYYSAEYHTEKTEEWKVEINKSNQILAIDPTGGSECWAINGPTFFKADLSSKLLSYIDEIYDQQHAAQWYWENVWMENLEDLPTYVRKYEHGTIVEFESLEELRAYDKSYLKESRSSILEIIKRELNCELTDIINIEILKAGMTNESFVFEVFNERYVFRNPGAGTEQLIKRQEEYEIYQLIKDLKISDDVIYMNPEFGYKITRFIENSEHFSYDKPEHMEMALDLLRILHNSGLECSHDFDIEERIMFYYDLCIKNNAILFNDFDDVFSNVKEIIKQLKFLDREKVLCHVDFVEDNFLFTKDRIYLLDWEYAGMADPLIDIAVFVVYGGLQDEEVVNLLEAYLQRTATKEELLITHSYVALAGFLWALWTQYKQSCGDDFGTYGMEQYQYARKYGRIVLNEK